MNAMSELYALQVQQAQPLARPMTPSGLGAYVPVSTVNPQVTQLVIYGSLGLIAIAVAFYLWNKE